MHIYAQPFFLFAAHCCASHSALSGAAFLTLRLSFVSAAIFLYTMHAVMRYTADCIHRQIYSVFISENVAPILFILMNACMPNVDGNM